MTSTAGVELTTINLLSKLTGMSYPDATNVTYGYDAAGNRLTETTGGSTVNYGYDAASQLTDVDGTRKVLHMVGIPKLLSKRLC